VLNSKPNKILRVGVLLVLASLALWPLFVISATTIDWFFGAGRYTTQLDLLPRKSVLLQFVHDMLNSMLVTLPLSLALLCDYLLFGRYAKFRIFFGLILIASVFATSYYVFPGSPYAVGAAVISALITVIFAKIYAWLFLPITKSTEHRNKPNSQSNGELA